MPDLDVPVSGAAQKHIAIERRPLHRVHWTLCQHHRHTVVEQNREKIMKKLLVSTHETNNGIRDLQLRATVTEKITFSGWLPK